ncbi:MAG: RNA polymerase subunit sigma-70, partial [Acidimicrobiaceae bacterium]|nr:RNA polymerase subunit sigma-70 [Acidimicrobiaceae bacterium]
MAKVRTETAEQDLVRLYLDGIGQYPLLTKDDEVRLSQAIESGREAAERLAAEQDRSRQRELRR